MLKCLMFNKDIFIAKSKNACICVFKFVSEEDYNFKSKSTVKALLQNIFITWGSDACFQT